GIQPVKHHALAEVQNLLRLYVSNLAYLNGTAGAIGRAVGKLSSLKAWETKKREIAFNSTRKWGAIELADRALVLGAAEMLLSPTQNRDLLETIQVVARTGVRIVVFGTCHVLPPDENLIGKIEPLALISLSDQMREDIQQTLQSFAEQDVELKVISGDSA